MKKCQMLKNPKKYFDLEESLKFIPNIQSFNNLLFQNYIDHFFDIRELYKTANYFSFNNIAHDFKYRTNTREDQYFSECYLNSYGIMTYNLSQYESEKEYLFII